VATLTRRHTVKLELRLKGRSWRGSEVLLSLSKTKLAMNYSAAFYSDGRRDRPKRSGMREADGQTSRSVLIDRLPRKIDPQWMQHRIFRRWVKIMKILGKNTSAVVDPYTDSLPRKAAINDEVEVMIAIHVHGGDIHTQSIRVREGKRTWSFSLAQLQLNAVKISTVALFDVPTEGDIGFVIAIQIA
jgi:hypothetical protein